MLELLRMQAQTQAQQLTNCVHALARDPLAPEQLNACASAARSFEGTALTVGLQAGAELARAMEDCVAAVRRGEIELQQELIGMMLQAVELLDSMTKLTASTSPLSVMDAEEEWPERGSGKPVLVVDDSPGCPRARAQVAAVSRLRRSHGSGRRRSLVRGAHRQLRPRVDRH